MADHETDRALVERMRGCGLMDMRVEDIHALADALERALDDYDDTLMHSVSEQTRLRSALKSCREVAMASKHERDSDRAICDIVDEALDPKHDTRGDG